MNIDLGELMRERSADAARMTPIDRLTQVRRRIGRQRRRRAVGATAAVLAVLFAMGVGVVLRGESTPKPAPVTTMRMIDGFPEYQAGARVIGTGVAELPETEVSVTVASNLDLAFTARCDPRMWLQVRVAGRADFFGLSCGPSGSAVWRPDPDLLAQYGVAPGEPVTYIATVTDGTAPGGEDLSVPERGTFALAVMQRVPFAEYPLPPRPATLPSLDSYLRTDAETLLTSDPLDPDRPVSRTFAWSADQELHAISNSPGLVHIAINGTRVVTLENWDYVVAETDVGLNDEDLPQFAEGTLVTVTVDVEHFSGAWAVWVSPRQ